MNGTYTAYPQKLQSFGDELLEKLDSSSIIDAISNSTKAILKHMEKKDGMVDRLCSKIDQLIATIDAQNGQPEFSRNRDFYEPDPSESEPQSENDWQL